MLQGSSQKPLAARPAAGRGDRGRRSRTHQSLPLRIPHAASDRRRFAWYRHGAVRCAPSTVRGALQLKQSVAGRRVEDRAASKVQYGAETRARTAFEMHSSQAPSASTNFHQCLRSTRWVTYPESALSHLGICATTTSTSLDFILLKQAAAAGSPSFLRQETCTA